MSQKEKGDYKTYIIPQNFIDTGTFFGGSFWEWWYTWNNNIIYS